MGMKKILFNDRYGLTQAVLDGRKTQTRRICKEQYWAFSDLVNAKNGIFHFEIPKYRIGEVVAVAQSYQDCGGFVNGIPQWDIIASQVGTKTLGWGNKLFVRADLMPHRIRIINVRVERLQDISDEDVVKEGFSIENINNGWGNAAGHWEYILTYLDGLGRYRQFRDRSAQQAYAYLMDRISGNGTWERNPFVFVYDFELIK